jgi:hypothetical protein
MIFIGKEIRFPKQNQLHLKFIIVFSLFLGILKYHRDLLQFSVQCFEAAALDEYHRHAFCLDEVRRQRLAEHWMGDNGINYSPAVNVYCDGQFRCCKYLCFVSAFDRHQHEWQKEE